MKFILPVLATLASASLTQALTFGYTQQVTNTEPIPPPPMRFARRQTSTADASGTVFCEDVSEGIGGDDGEFPADGEYHTLTCTDGTLMAFKISDCDEDGNACGQAIANWAGADVDMNACTHTSDNSISVFNMWTCNF
ncbi:hypothetical protein CLCR_02157 [Cladophialophora carrionii]|uniref:Uncharacterized protein n=1 Tax=Cladophialophora carrionii TaxID=86049 RepID=A0A1C1CDI5_9EURO|nr:hypothetical protein CLCR_02157 [Cladophialophora carrionii]